MIKPTPEPTYQVSLRVNQALFDALRQLAVVEASSVNQVSIRLLKEAIQPKVKYDL